jgi:hypothetical protein
MRGPRKSVRGKIRSWMSWLKITSSPRAFSLVVTRTVSWRIVQVTFSPAAWVIRLSTLSTAMELVRSMLKTTPPSTAACSAAGSVIIGMPVIALSDWITVDRLSSSLPSGRGYACS